MHIRADAIVCAVRTHGENGTIARVLTRDHGLLAGYVRGGRSRRLRPVLMPGNRIVAELRARVETQLPAMTVELSESRAPLLAEPLPAAAIEWVTVLTATALPEGQPYPMVYDALEAMIATVALSSAARAWAGVLVHFERGLLAALGYGAEDEEERGLFAALEENEVRLSANLLTGRAAQVLDARERLVARLRRALLHRSTPGSATAEPGV